jgi:hypothetical protein
MPVLSGISKHKRILQSHYLTYKDESMSQCVCVCVYLLTAQEWMNQFAPNLACLFLETRKRFLKGQNSEKLS